jgi:hypothetical protein
MAEPEPKESPTIGGPAEFPPIALSSSDSPLTDLAAPSYVGALQDAELLMTYSAEIGVEVDGDTRAHILEARDHINSLSRDQTGKLLAALTKLAGQLRPVTVQSLRAAKVEGSRTIYRYLLLATCLAAAIVPFSITSFVASATTEEINKDLVTGNELEGRLTEQLRQAQSSPNINLPQETTNPQDASAEANIILELQRFVEIVNHIDSHAQTLNSLILRAHRDPYASIRGDPRTLDTVFQIPRELNLDVAHAAADHLAVYRTIRYFAELVMDDSKYFYDAVATYVLPVLYALLGTCAYLLRSFEEQTRKRTFIPSVANVARFLIAGIGGAVVGLFSNVTSGRGAMLPPLALAFLVGYSVDVFYSFLESLLTVFIRSKNDARASS